MMEFTYNGLVRWGFGFHNPNHAAAAICAILAFLWGWVLNVEGCGLRMSRFARWAGLAMSAVLFGALALTYSRTGFVVAALEVAAWTVVGGAASPQVAGRRDGGIAPYHLTHAPWGALLLLAVLALAAGIGGVAARFAPDASLMNRPAIWWAGLKLAAANPLGVGHGHSGMLVSTFMLDGIEVRTLVNSHLTLLAEQGWLAGSVWVAFIVAALAGGWRRHPRLWIAFAGLTASAFASSVFDWHVLFDFTEKGGLGALNFTLAWVLFVGYIAMGAALVFADGGSFAAGWRWRALAARLLTALAAVAGLTVLRPLVPVEGVPRVRDGFVVKSGRDMPLVLHDADWPLKAVVPYLKEGYLLAIKSGYAEPKEPPRSVWLFGTVAESAHRFSGATVIAVDPPEFCPLPSRCRRRASSAPCR